MPQNKQFLRLTLIVSLLITVIFGIILNGLTQYSFQLEEGFTAWIVHDEMREPETVRETLRFVRDSLLNTLNRVREDVHPPLYYLLLDVWTLLIGDSEFSLRLPSALMGTLSLATVYAIGRHWFNTRTGIISLLLLGTAGFYLYYSREAQIYSLYLVLATISTWLYSRWWQKSTLFRGLIYGIALALMLYTHYTAFVIILAHGLHALLTIRQWSKKSALWQIIIPYGLSALLFSAWIPIFLQQMIVNSGFSAPGVLTGDSGIVATLWLKLTSGYAGIFALVLILSRAVFSSPKKYHALLLISFQGLVPVIALFAINARGLSILQLPYLIPIVPAWSLLIAYLLSEMWILFVKNRRIGLALTVFFTGWIIYTQLATYHTHWQAKPDWRSAVLNVDTNREVDEPALIYLNLQSPLAYYAYQTGLLDGISINLSWREFAPQEIWQIADSLENASTVWGIVAMQAPQSWDAIVALSESRGVSYRDEVEGSVFYQFDTESEEALTFTFGTDSENQLLAHHGEFYTRYQANSGDEICVPIRLEALADISDDYAISLQLTRDYDELIARVDEVPGEYIRGDIIEEELCFTKPDEDDFHLRLIIYNSQTSDPLYVMEDNFVWGQYLMRGTVEQIVEE